jgi:signal transduction histidine kinase
VALALLDVNMPDMDGFALAEMMRSVERTRHVPIIFVTAATQEQHREFRGYDAGAVDFLFKPIDPRILRHKTETFYQLHRQKQQLEETLHFNETLMAVVGHDLRNPLHAMVLGADLILADPTSENNRKTATRLKSSSRRMQRMIDDLFDLARARLGGGIPIVPAPTDLTLIVKRVLAELETAHPERSITFSHQGNASGLWDGDRLAQVVSNLLTNSLRHGAKDAPVEVSVSAVDDQLTLTVHNAGVIPDDVRGGLFDPFRSSNKGVARGEGLGLGLFIVQHLVLGHGGAVDFQSSASEGTTFRVVLPRQPAD